MLLYKISVCLDNEFINVKFEKGELEHGQRYMVCIHSEHTEIVYEKWTQVLPEINECSDGIVVDLTPPTAGKIWIGNRQGLEYQVIKVFQADINRYEYKKTYNRQSSKQSFTTFSCLRVHGRSLEH